MPPRNERVIFLGGAPGTGKSTAAAAVLARVPTLHVATAGDLIRRGLGREGAYVRPPVAGAEEAVFFQELLLAEFSRIRARHMGPVLLEGHYAVPTADGPVILLEVVFRRLGCTDLLLLEATASELAARLRERGGAAWWDGTVGEAARLATAERQGAERVANALGLGLATVKLPTAVEYLEQLVLGTLGPTGR